MGLFFVNFIFLLWRIGHRMIFTARIYDWRHGLMAAPRLVVSNFVNFFASVRATRIYIGHRATGKALTWDKTAHSYPIQMRAPSRPAPEKSRRGPERQPARLVGGRPAKFAAPSDHAGLGRPDAVHAPSMAPSSTHWTLIFLTVAGLAGGGPLPGSGEARAQAVPVAASAEQVAEAAARSSVDQLARAGRKRDALAEADRFIARQNAGALTRAQRGFLRRELGDPGGAAEDFAAALKDPGELSPDQRRNVEAGLVEARAAQNQGELAQAQGDLELGRYVDAANRAGLVLDRDPGSAPAMRIHVEALVANGQKREALVEADQFVRANPADSLMRAQRGFLRREFKDLAGAIEDFNAVLGELDLLAEQRRNVEAGLAEAQTAQAQQDILRAQAALRRRDFATASDAAAAALRRIPNSEDAVRIRVEALSRTGRKPDALDEADRFIARGTASTAFRAERGFLRRALNDTAGAAEDFTAALAGGGLAAEQQRNVQKALREATAAAGRRDYESAQVALRRGDFTAAAEIADSILRREPGSRAAMRIRLDALSRAGRKQDAQAQADRLIAAGDASGWVLAQRGFGRLEAGDFAGAVEDFDAALARRDLDQRAIPNIRYARAEAAAGLAEQKGDPRVVHAAYLDLLQKEPGYADGWYRLGYRLIREGDRAQAAEALGNGLKIRPVGSAYLDEGESYMFTNAPLAAKALRNGLDRWYDRDPSLASRSQADLERVKNEVVEADASIRTTVAVGGISARPEAAGGTNALVSAETRVRFDGRFLPAVPGLEAFARGFTGKDSNGTRETDAGVGVRYRPIRDLNFYVGGVVDHFFQPQSETEFVLIWGLGLGTDAYPYLQGWKPYWDFGTFGAWRTADGRVLQDLRGNAGYLYEFRAPLRAAVGPTLLGVAGYDNQASTPLAGGIGPSVLSYFWLGGDKYRSYDALLSLQVGYLFNVGSDQRQRGWRGQVGVTF